MRSKQPDPPIIDPKNCPGEMIKYFQRTRAADRQETRLMIRDELKPVHKFAQIAANNRLWLQILTVAVIVGFVVGGLMLLGSL